MTTEIQTNGGIIMMPRAPGSDTPETPLNLTKVFQTLGRLDEISVLTSAKAPELMTAFNKAHLLCGRYSCQVGLEKAKAKSALDEIEAQIVLYKAPKMLADLKLRDSEATRQAVCNLDPAYQSARETFDKLVALHKFLDHLTNDLEMGYSSSKKILGEHPWALTDQRNEFDGVVDENKRAGETQDSLYGTPR